MFPRVGAVGVGVDLTQWILWKRELHTAADLGALAGARALVDKQPVQQAVTPNAQSSSALNSWPLIKSNTVINPALNGNCFQGLQINKGVTVTLLPGTYVIGEKGISVAGGATLRGTGVTLIFISTAGPFNSGKVGSFSAAGISTIDLSAPTSGTYKGVLMYQDPRTPDTSQNAPAITGNSSCNSEGTIYAPSVRGKFTGNSGMDTKCMQIAARYVPFEGNTDVSNTCPAGSGGTVRLVR